MAPQKYWSINKWDTGAGIWISDTQIPRAGLEPFNRTKEATISFVTLASGDMSISSTEKKANWQKVNLVFPHKIVTETFKTQLQDYSDNEQGLKIIIPITSGSSSYSEKVLEGYITNYREDWVLDGKSTQSFDIRIEFQEFDVDNDNSI